MGKVCGVAEPMLKRFCLPLLAALACSTAQAADVPKYASIIVDLDNLEILHARQIDRERFPASLTKVMTLYLVFDALERGQISMNEKLAVSRRAAQTPAIHLGLRAGQTISVKDAIDAVAIRSANDAAVVLAERLAGSEDEFAELMTAKARALGMQTTRFRNAHGLTDPGQVTSARDMAKLAEAILRSHGKYAHFFEKHQFSFRGRTFKNHNNLLKMPGVGGLKTGYTSASGYNLIITAERDGRRLAAVVLGGASGNSRDSHMKKLINRGFEVMRKAAAQPAPDYLNLNAPVPVKQAAKKNRPDAVFMRASHVTSTAAKLRQPAGNNWLVQIGAFGTYARAGEAVLAAQSNPTYSLAAYTPQISRVSRGSEYYFRARMSGFDHNGARAACLRIRAAGQPCHIVAPK